MKNKIHDIRLNIARVMVGREQVTDLLLASFFAGGHVLLEDMPGTGKTVLARSMARSMDVRFGRIQFTPDLLPGDVTGIHYYHQEKGEFVFREAPQRSETPAEIESGTAFPQGFDIASLHEKYEKARYGRQ